MASLQVHHVSLNCSTGSTNNVNLDCGLAALVGTWFALIMEGEQTRKDH